jgi:hypothetical protein
MERLPTDGDWQLSSPQLPTSLAQMSPISPHWPIHALLFSGSVIASVISCPCTTADAMSGSTDPPHRHMPPLASQPLPVPMSGCTP